MSRLMLALVAAAATAVAGSVTAATVTVDAPEAPAYGSRPATSAAEIELAELLTARWPALEFDGALAEAATTYARATIAAGETTLGGEVLERVLRRAGCLDPGGRAVVVSTTEDDPSDVLEALAGVLGAAPAPTHAGLARVPLPAAASPFRWRWAATVVARRLKLATPVPRRVAPAAPVVLEFELQAGFADPELVTLGAAGDVARHAALRQAAPVWRSTIVAPAVAGRLTVQVLATGALGREVVGLLAFEVAPPGSGDQSGELSWSHPAPPPGEQELAPTERLRQLVNRFRVAHGRLALVADPVLDRVALDHTEDLVLRGVLSHRSESGDELSERLRGAGYRYRVALENLARAADVTAAHESLARSPSHRANLLSREVSALGLGVVETVTDNGHREVVVTEVLSDPVEVASAAEVRRLAAALWRRAAGRGPATAAVTDPALDAVAEALASLPDLATHSSSELLSQLRGRLAGTAADPGTIAFEVTVAGTLAELAAPSAPAVLAAPRRGLGAAVIDPGDAPPRLQVVYVGGY